MAGNLQIDPRFRPITIPWEAWRQESGLTDTEQKVIGVLIWHGENSFPSLQRIADMGGYCKDTVIRALGSLKEKGWVTVEQRKKPDGSLTSNHYIVSCPEGGSLNFRQGVVAKSDGGYTENQTVTKIQKPLNSEEQERPSVPSPEPAPVEDDGPSRKTLSDMLKFWDQEVTIVMGRCPPRVWGRDMKMAKRLYECYGETNFRLMVAFHAKNAQARGYPITLPRFFQFAEETFQRLPRPKATHSSAAPVEKARWMWTAAEFEAARKAADSMISSKTGEPDGKEVQSNANVRADERQAAPPEEFDSGGVAAAGLDGSLRSGSEDYDAVEINLDERPLGESIRSAVARTMHGAGEANLAAALEVGSRKVALRGTACFRKEKVTAGDDGQGGNNRDSRGCGGDVR